MIKSIKKDLKKYDAKNIVYISIGIEPQREYTDSEKEIIEKNKKIKEENEILQNEGKALKKKFIYQQMDQEILFSKTRKRN